VSVLNVVDPGPLALVQDLGRAGGAAMGVGRSGAFDAGAHRLAQRLCGNDPNAAGIEVLLGGLVVRVEAATVIAVTGARVGVLVDDVAHGTDHAVFVPAGAQVRLTTATAGARAYVAVRGGIAAKVVLDSRSRDTLGSIGPPPLGRGAVLRIGDLAVGDPWIEPVPVADPPAEIALRVAPGPHDDVLDDDGWSRLHATAWAVDARSDRVGVRLSGDPLPAPASDLPSFPVVPGCVQLPSDGRPVVLGPDAGVTGGYPVLGVIDPAGLDALAQARPGATVRLRRAAR
jgi:biotin-dependent carboxylase-like uncharacterized protein